MTLWIVNLIFLMFCSCNKDINKTEKLSTSTTVNTPANRGTDDKLGQNSGTNGVGEPLSSDRSASSYLSPESSPQSSLNSDFDYYEDEVNNENSNGNNNLFSQIETPYVNRDGKSSKNNRLEDRLIEDELISIPIQSSSDDKNVNSVEELGGNTFEEAFTPSNTKSKNNIYTTPQNFINSDSGRSTPNSMRIKTPYGSGIISEV